MNSKPCFKCGEVKSLSDFYRHAGMADGHLNKCKECTKTDSANTRNAKIEYYREYDRKRGNRQTNEYLKNYKENNPKKARAHRMIAYHLRTGNIKRGNCEICGSEKTHGHHDDYDFPLSVRWLCAAHHKQWHNENGEGLNC
jgi:hypothetical protein